MKRIYSLSGNIGVGKSTRLAKYKNKKCTFLQEPIITTKNFVDFAKLKNKFDEIFCYVNPKGTILVENIKKMINELENTTIDFTFDNYISVLTSFLKGNALTSNAVDTITFYQMAIMLKRIYDFVELPDWTVIISERTVYDDYFVFVSNFVALKILDYKQSVQLAYLPLMWQHLTNGTDSWFYPYLNKIVAKNDFATITNKFYPEAIKIYIVIVHCSPEECAERIKSRNVDSYNIDYLTKLDKWYTELPTMLQFMNNVQFIPDESVLEKI